MIFESFKPAASAIVTHEIARRPSNWRSQMSIAEWAERNDLPGITGVDTRALIQQDSCDYSCVKRQPLSSEVKRGNFA